MENNDIMTWPCWKLGGEEECLKSRYPCDVHKKRIYFKMWIDKHGQPNLESSTADDVSPEEVEEAKKAFIRLLNKSCADTSGQEWHASISLRLSKEVMTCSACDGMIFNGSIYREKKTFGKLEGVFTEVTHNYACVPEQSSKL